MLLKFPMKVLLLQNTNCNTNICGIINCHIHLYGQLCTNTNVTLCPCNTNVTLYAFINMAPTQSSKKTSTLWILEGNETHLHKQERSETRQLNISLHSAHYESYYRGLRLVISIIFRLGLDRVPGIPWRLGWQSLYITIHFRSAVGFFFF